MRNILTLVITSLLLLMAQYAFSQKGLIDKVVAVVGGEAILLSDIESEMYMMKAQGTMLDENSRCRVFEGKLLEKLLLAQAKIDSLEVNEDAVKNDVERHFNFMVSQMGSIKAVEDYFKMPAHKIKERQTSVTRERVLSQQMRGKIVQNVELTPDDVRSYFKNLPSDSLPKLPDQYVLQQVVLYPPSSDANFLAREELLGIRERILNGEKFSTLAIMYSEDTESARRGGELGLRQVQDYAPAFADAAKRLKPGQVSQIVETEYGMHIIQMIDKQSNDLVNVRHILVTPKFSADDKRFTIAKLDSIRNLILKDSITFEKAADRYSQEPKSKIGGGIAVNPHTASTIFEKDQLEPGDYLMVKDLKLGDISAPYEAKDEKGKVVYKFIRLKELVPSHVVNIVDDFSVIKQLAESQKQMEIFKKWLKKKQAATFIKMDPEYHTCKFEFSGWVK